MTRLPPARITIEPLTSEHEISFFSCGYEQLDRYLKRQASQDIRKNVAATFVMTERGSRKIIGFYTLAAASVRVDRFPERFAKKLPKYPLVPAILLGRLGVDLAQKGKGYGEVLLMDALNRCLKIKDIGWMAIVVDAKDDNSATFYEHYHFIRFSAASRRLFLPRPTIATILA
jgi:GNAT superfamily N-acetyltransferase